jgi:hypothetical protein
MSTKADQVHIELLVPYVESGKRPGIRFSQRNDPKAFQTVEDMYSALWEASLPPQASPNSTQGARGADYVGGDWQAEEAQRLLSQTLTIVAAKYISRTHPDRLGNVKKSIRALVRDNKLEIKKVENDLFKSDIPPDGDPDYGFPKKLVVDFQIGNGPVMPIEADEDGTLRLPPP